MKIKYRKIKKGLNSISGVKALGVSSGIKGNNRLDLAMIFFDEPFMAEAVFTKNKIKAAPVKVAKAKVSKGLKKIILINSGNANACTGEEGIKRVNEIEKYAAEKFGVSQSAVISSSTGIIGVQIPIDKIRKGIDSLFQRAAKKEFFGAAEAIMTTDTFPKEFGVEVFINGKKKFSIAGMAKGAGMIAPDMATMLSFIATDLPLERQFLKRTLRDTVDKTFNCITIDGDMSTNDSVFCFAPPLERGKKPQKYILDAFKRSLSICMDELAKKIVEDGEGSTKFVEIKIEGAKSTKDAKTVASKIANSLLFKCALFGKDPNWGRIAASAGASGAEIYEEKIDIYFGKMKAVSSGKFKEEYRKKLIDYFKRKNMEITVDLNIGNGSAKVYTCDLSFDYVKINSEYN
ncbi:MAG: bifunctional glutamate N-acetyltransferase/amino-acid acetyltransferase ArgJ [Candidatus Schekmanbacteria bacterium]|nr:MAG: bifunctional glutamate N-acetyltransferase/amino-acid acetyltransferase ArgJ [Candidatus Schekmanbacteria bacterium]